MSPAAEGGAAQRLTENEAGDYGPAWSPDGTEIAFTSWRDNNKEIYVLPATGGQARNLTGHPADDEDPAWAAGWLGSGLCLLARRGCPDRQSQCGNLPTDLADGSTERLTDNPWPDQDPAWDVEGRLVWAAYEPWRTI